MRQGYGPDGKRPSCACYERNWTFRRRMITGNARVLQPDGPGAERPWSSRIYPNAERIYGGEQVTSGPGRWIPG